MDTISPNELEHLLQNGLNPDSDNYPVAKIYGLHNNATYLLIDLEEEEGNFAFALFDDGKGFPHFIYVWLALNNSEEKPQVQYIKEASFIPKFPISVYAKAARQYGAITDDECLLLPIAEAQKGQLITSTALVIELDIEQKHVGTADNIHARSAAVHEISHFKKPSPC